MSVTLTGCCLANVRCDLKSVHSDFNSKLADSVLFLRQKCSQRCEVMGSYML